MIFNIRSSIVSLLLILLVSAGCKKEKMPAATDLDENYLVVKDNPGDPVDHSIFQFYASTGIPSFYKDTVSKKKVGESGGISQYAYQTVSLGYSPLGNADAGVILTKNKQFIPSVLDLLKTELLPKIPKDIFIPSILFVDSFWLDMPGGYEDPSVGWDACQGFNTFAIKCRDVSVMNAAEKKMYIASILTGIVTRKMVNKQSAKLQQDFYSVSRAMAMPELQSDVYGGIILEFMLPFIPPPEHWGFIKWVSLLIQYDPSFQFYLTMAPREADDLRMFLVSALYYTTQEFDAKYSTSPEIKQKFRIMQQMATAIGLQLP